MTPAFFWIPTAGLSAVIIHAVADLVASPRQVYGYWRVSPLEFVIWFAAVIVTVFSTIEDGIYTSICASLALLLVRIAHPRGYFLGKITLRQEGHQSGRNDESVVREVYVPLNPKPSLMNASVKITPPAPGVIVYRFEESFLYPNSYLLNSTLVDYVKTNMRRGKDMSAVKLSDRPWNDPGPRRGVDEQNENLEKPVLRAIVLDFSGVSQIDTTAIQALIDTRNEIERWVDRPVEVRVVSIYLVLAMAYTHCAVPFCHYSFTLGPSSPHRGGFRHWSPCFECPHGDRSRCTVPGRTTTNITKQVIRR